MTAKNLFAAMLLIFVGASIVVLVRREMRGATAESTGLAVEQLPANALVVYYFHGQTRCPTCRNIEDYSHAAVEADFAEELAQDKVLWRVVDYEHPENSHFAADYNLVSPTVVIVRMKDGRVADWRNLARVWELIGDRDAFTDYVQHETRSMLGS